MEGLEAGVAQGAQAAGRGMALEAVDRYGRHLSLVLSRLVVMPALMNGQRPRLEDLLGRTVAVVGDGPFLQGLTRRLRSLGADVIPCSPATPPLALAGALRRSELSVLGGPDSAQVTLSEEAFAELRPGARLVVSLPGAALNGAQLLEALHDGRVAAAAFDLGNDEVGGPTPLRCDGERFASLAQHPHVLISSAPNAATGTRPVPPRQARGA